MRPRTSFDRTTTKLFVAAFFVLGGLQCMDLHAQVFTATTANLPTCYVSANGHALIQGYTLSGPAAVAIRIDDAAGGSALFSINAGADGFYSLALPAPQGAVATAQAQGYMSGAGTVSCTPDTCPPVYVGSRSETESAPLPLSISKWNNAFTSGTDTSEWTTVGSPNPGNGPMSVESLAAHPTCAVYANGQRALIQGAALHDDAAAACTNPDNAPAPGLGLAGVAISNSTPAAETTEHVDQAVDATTLF